MHMAQQSALRIVRQRGLTLVELMVVVAVLAVLATVAYPLYTNQVQKARRADAKVALETIAMAQERRYTVEGSYASSLADGTLNLSGVLSGGNSEEGYYTLTLTGGGQTFQVAATKTGAQQDDNDCKQFTINQLGTKSAKNQADADAPTCW